MDKEVNIVYEFHRQLHSVTVSEKDGIMIPKEGIVIRVRLVKKAVGDGSSMRIDALRGEG